MGYRVGRVSPRAALSWSRWPDGCGFRGVFRVGRIFDEAVFCLQAKKLLHPGVRAGRHYLISLSVLLSVCVCQCVCNIRRFH